MINKEELVQIIDKSVTIIYEARAEGKD